MMVRCEDDTKGSRDEERGTGHQYCISGNTREQATKMSTAMGTIPTRYANLSAGDGYTRAKGNLTAMADAILEAFGEDRNDEHDPCTLWHGPTIPNVEPMDVDAHREHLAWSALAASDSRLSTRGADSVPGTVSAFNVKASDTSKRSRVSMVARWASDPTSLYITPDGRHVALGDHLIVNGDAVKWVRVAPVSAKTTANRTNGRKNRAKVRKCGHGEGDGYVKGCDTCYAAAKTARARAKRAASETTTAAEVARQVAKGETARKAAMRY